MAQDILKRLRQSIKERRCTLMRYDGQQHIRVVEPHVIYTDKDGTVLVGCFQTRGPGNAGTRTATWQLLRLSGIESVFLLDIEFKIRIDQGFNPESPDFQHGLIAIVETAGASSRIIRGNRPSTMLWSQARGWLWGVGSVIDRVLSDRGWDPHDH
ncbi:MAG: hypothetical protein ACYDHY_07975 [Acidiferrobacterales bacterium]